MKKILTSILMLAGCALFSSAQVSIVPKAGNVEKLESFTITFSDATTIEKGALDYGNAPFVVATDAYNPGTSAGRIWCFTMNFSGNVMSLTPMKAVTDDGEYDLHLPAGFYNVDGTPSAEELIFHYTIGGEVEPEIIYEAPEGKVVSSYVWYSNNWFVTGQGNSIAQVPVMGKPTEYVICDNGDFYLLNPVMLEPFKGMSYQLNTYIKGHLEDGIVTCQFPQPVGIRETFGTEQTIYANRLKYVIDDEGKADYRPFDKDKNIVRYELNADDSLTMLDMSTSTNEQGDMLGISTADGDWAGYGVWGWVLKVMEDEALTPPADIETQMWSYTDAEGGASFVNIGIENSRLWIQGLSRKYLPNAWSCGKIDGTTVTFPMKQYMGETDVLGQYVWLIGDGTSENDSHIYDLTMTLNSTSDEMTANENIGINCNTIISYCAENYQLAKFKKLPADFQPIPKAVSISNFQTTSNATQLTFKFEKKTADDVALDPSKLFFCLYDTEGNPYTLSADEYPLLKEDTQLFPSNCYYYGVFEIQGTTAKVTLKMPELENIGVAAVYVDNDKEYTSEIVYAKTLPGSVSSIEIASEADWYTVTGLKVAYPEKGVYLKVTKTKDGSIKTEKVIL